MDNTFLPVKTTRKVQTNIEKFETLSLKDNSTSRPPSAKSKISILDLNSETSESPSEPFSLRPSIDSSITSISKQSIPKSHKRQDSTAFIQRSYLSKDVPASLPDDARAILKSKPDREDLTAVLQYLQYGIDGKHDFNIQVPGPQASQIINVLVTSTIPDQWPYLNQPHATKDALKMKKTILSCLGSIAGLGALLMQIRRLSTNSPHQNNPLLADMVSVLAAELSDQHVLRRFLSDADRFFASEASRRVFWQEVVALFAGSKILTIMAQVFATVRDLNDKHSWLGNGTDYSRWLSRNVCAAAIDLNVVSDKERQSLQMLGQVLKRGLSLGYRDVLISELYKSLLLGNRALWTTLHSLLQTLPTYDQRAVFDVILGDLARQHLPSQNYDVGGTNDDMKTKTSIRGAAAMIQGLVQSNSIMESHLLEWLTVSNGEYSGLGLGLRRAVIATVAKDAEKLRFVLEKNIARFGDKLGIQHESMLQQEATAQTMLITIGYLNRLNHESIKQISSSGLFLNMVSHRLSASLPRARFLGMIIATSMSSLVDISDKKMNFGTAEMDSEDAKAWSDLININDPVGTLEDLPKSGAVSQKRKQSPQPARTFLKRQTPQHTIPQTSKIISIEELSESEEADNASSDEEDPDLQPYAPPDSDPEDSDEDATLVNRNKPIAPVYITTLIKQLNVTDDLSTITVALRTAPSLIRRKADFGDELSANVIRLAASLLNLQDGIDERELQQLRLDSLIACLVSKPWIIGPWISNMYFEGDFSLSQRVALLTTIGLGVRQLAGHDDNISDKPDEDNALTPTPLPASSFPSKRLPTHLESRYLTESSPLSQVSSTLSHRVLQPMALEAADKLTGPNILKIRTFSSRLAVEKKTAAKADARSKRIPKDLHKLVAEAIYLPFCSRLSLVLSSLSTTPYLANSTLLHPSLLNLSLQTLTITLSTLGPHAMQLYTLTRETLLLLTTIHTLPHLAHDPTILPAILHLLLTLLDMNIEAGNTAQERLVTDFGAAFAELVSWAGELGDTVSIPVEPSPQESGVGALPWPILVAGVQVKWHEVGKRFQGRMLGLMAGTDFRSF